MRRLKNKILAGILSASILTTFTGCEEKANSGATLDENETNSSVTENVTDTPVVKTTIFDDLEYIAGKLDNKSANKAVGMSLMVRSDDDSCSGRVEMAVNGENFMLSIPSISVKTNGMTVEFGDLNLAISEEQKVYVPVETINTVITAIAKLSNDEDGANSIREQLTEIIGDTKYVMLDIGYAMSEESGLMDSVPVDIDVENFNTEALEKYGEFIMKEYVPKLKALVEKYGDEFNRTEGGVNTFVIDKENIDTCLTILKEFVSSDNFITLVKKGVECVSEMSVTDPDDIPTGAELDEQLKDMQEELMSEIWDAEDNVDKFKNLDDAKFVIGTGIANGSILGASGEMYTITFTATAKGEYSVGDSDSAADDSTPVDPQFTERMVVADIEKIDAELMFSIDFINDTTSITFPADDEVCDILRVVMDMQNAE